MKNKINITDQTGRKINLIQPPEKIVSLVPSVTFLLYLLNLEKQTTGITRFCKYPKHWKKQKTIVGGTKDIKIEKITQLMPEFIIANKEENSKQTVENLEKTVPIYVSDVVDLKSNKKFVTDIGQITGKTNEAENLLKQIDFLTEQLHKTKSKTYKSLYLIWREPWMSIGGDTFISHMMQVAGFENILINEQRYPVVDFKQIKQQPEVIFLSSEPFPFKEKHKIELQKIFPQSEILLVKGEAFTWFGAYPVFGLPYLFQLYQKIKNNA